MKFKPQFETRGLHPEKEGNTAKASGRIKA